MPELLAPVRDEISFTAAVDAGADAVYFGLGQLNMRVNSKGFDIETLPRIVRSAHAKKVKAYVTLNTIVYDEELGQVGRILEEIKDSKVDGVICWDPAVIQKARQMDLSVHISTQANVSNIEAACFYERLGAERIVPARELTLEQITSLKQNTKLEIEIFVHGAMCVSVSGRCFMSQFLAGRSANRGDCLQPCRGRYEITNTETNEKLELHNNYIMSPKDLCTLAVVDRLIATGVDAFKIEGRSRPPEYIRTVVRAYRKAIDAVQADTFDQQLVEQLTTEVATVYNRGFSTGFLFGKPTPQDWSDRYGSCSTRKKLYVGPILNYYKKKNVAYAKIVSHKLSTGDKIQIHGPTTGIVDLEITQLKSDEQNAIIEMKKGKVTFPCSTLLRRNDKIYKIVEDK